MVARRAAAPKPSAEAIAEMPTFEATDLAAGRNTGANLVLLSFCERYERLSEEIDALGEDRTEVMAEAKSSGFDTKVLKQAVRRRKMPKSERQEADALLETYERALEEAEKAAFKQSQYEAG